MPNADPSGGSRDATALVVSPLRDRDDPSIAEPGDGFEAVNDADRPRPSESRANTVSPVKSEANARCGVGRTRRGSKGRRAATRQRAIASPTADA